MTREEKNIYVLTPRSVDDTKDTFEWSIWSKNIFVLKKLHIINPERGAIVRHLEADGRRFLDGIPAEAFGQPIEVPEVRSEGRMVKLTISGQCFSVVIHVFESRLEGWQR